jgi:hypothetical protein
MARIKEYALSLPNREKKAVEITIAQFEHRLETAKKYFVYGFRKFTIADVRRKYRLNNKQGSEFYIRLKEIEKEFESNTFGKVTKVVEPVRVRVIPTLADRLRDIRLAHESDIRKHGEQAKFAEGFVYIVENPAYAGWIKVGMTIDYEKRLYSYNVPNDPHRAYSYVRVAWTNDRRTTEKDLLERFEAKSLARKGEWFEVEKSLAISLFDL